jgi:hypothetical protein
MATTTEHLEALLQTDPGEAQRLIRSVQKKLWVPHDGQREVIDSEARFRILRAGRRWGKTQLAAHEVIMAALEKPNQMVWWVSVSDKSVRRGYRHTLAQLPYELLAKEPPSETANDRILRFNNGSQIEFYTSGTPDSLAGEGVNFLVMDEAALIDGNVWYQLLRPTLSDTHGRALIISTPRGRNWFWQMVRRAESNPGATYASFHYPSVTSPYMDPDELEDAKQTLPDLMYRSEYLAEFVANAASMFTVTDETIRPLHAPRGHVVLGIDLAKKQDWTVITGCNSESRAPCVFERMNQVSWPIQEELIIQTVRDLENDPLVDGVTCVIDSTGVGDVVFDHLEDQGLDVVPVNFGSGLQKERMVRLLAADMEHERAFIVPEMVEEFEHYEYNISETTGRYKFEASIGHDDMVSAKLLEHWGVIYEGPPDVNVWDPLEDALEAVEEAVPIVRDSPADIMRRPEAWNSFR